MKNRIVIIGLDGATFDLLAPWMDAGLLPSLAHFRNRAASGILNSTIPPTTPPAWTTCFTGLNPGRHGIFDFTDSPLKNRGRPLVSSCDTVGLRMWQIIADHGGRSIIVNVPMTYPPEPILGDMISGMLAPDFESEFTFPESLKHEIKAVCGSYIPNLDVPRYDPGDTASLHRFLEDLRESTERRLEAIRHLMDNREWSFLFAVFIGMDRIQHLIFKLLKSDGCSDPIPTDSGAPINLELCSLRSAAIREYQRIDRAVGEIIEKAGADASIFIVSDHGFGATEAYFNANAWLIDQGLLKVHPLPYLKKRLFHWAMQFDESNLGRQLIPRSLSRTIRTKIRSTRSTAFSARTDIEHVIDWDRSSAFFASIPTQGIYINEALPGMTSNRIEELKEMIRDKLYSLSEKGSSTRLVDAVWFREDIFAGTEMRWAPHIAFKMKDYSILGRQHLGTGSWFTSCQHLPIGFHRSEGIVMVSTPGIPPQIISNMQIRDIMPTALYAAHVPVPNNLDGRVVTELFDPLFLADHPVQYSDYSHLTADTYRSDESPFSNAEQNLVNERLKNLGYLE